MHLCTNCEVSMSNPVARGGVHMPTTTQDDDDAQSIIEKALWLINQMS